MLTDPRQQRVLMVLESDFSSRGGGGAEKQVATLSKYLASRGLGVKVLSPMVSYGPQKAKDNVDGIAVQRIAYPKIRVLGGAVMLARLAAYLVKNRRDYDAIHVHVAHHMAAVCCVIGRYLCKPVVVKFTGWLEIQHGVLSQTRHDVIVKCLRIALKRASFYQATSRQIANLLCAGGFDGQKVCYLPNAVDTAHFSSVTRAALETERQSSGRPLVGVYVGRLVKEKALDLLISAWANSFSTEDNVRLFLVGEGELRAQLSALVHELRREHQIVFCGASDCVERYLSLADFGILPSLYEGLSNSLLEYMAAGLPVVGSRISGTEDLVVDDETGWVFASGDHDGLVACLRRIEATPKERLRAIGARARRRVSEFAGIESVAGKLADLYGFGGEYKGPGVGRAAMISPDEDAAQVV